MVIKFAIILHATKKKNCYQLNCDIAVIIRHDSERVCISELLNSTPSLLESSVGKKKNKKTHNILECYHYNFILGLCD